MRDYHGKNWFASRLMSIETLCAATILNEVVEQIFDLELDTFSYDKDHDLYCNDKT